MSLKLDGLHVRRLMEIIVFLISLIICSMNPETAVTFNHDHFNQAVFVLALCDRNRILYNIYIITPSHNSIKLPLS